MSWAFATEVPEDRTITIACDGDLALVGDDDVELSASVEPAEFSEDEDGLRLVFGEEVRVLVPIPARAKALRVERCADLRSARLRCSLEVKEAAGDIRIADHHGGVAVQDGQGDVVITALRGGLEVHRAQGDTRIRDMRGGVMVHHGEGDVSINEVGGGVMVEACAGDVTVRSMHGGTQVVSVAGDCTVSDMSGGLQVDSVGGDFALTSFSGGLQVGSVAGDVAVREASGGQKLGAVAGSCRAESVSGSLEVEEVAGDLRIEEASGSTSIGAVGGKASLVKVSGSLRVTHVAGPAQLQGIHAGEVSVVAAGDIVFAGKLPPEARCELVSEEGSVTVEVPEEPKPVLARVEAGGGVVCEIPEAETEGPGPRLDLRAAQDVHVIAATRVRRPGRPRKGEAERRVARAPQDLKEERLVVLRMVETGKVSAEEGARLLEAIDGG